MFRKIPIGVGIITTLFCLSVVGGVATAIAGEADEPSGESGVETAITGAADEPSGENITAEESSSEENAEEALKGGENAESSGGEDTGEESSGETEEESGDTEEESGDTEEESDHAGVSDDNGDDNNSDSEGGSDDNSDDSSDDNPGGATELGDTDPDDDDNSGDATESEKQTLNVTLFMPENYIGLQSEEEQEVASPVYIMRRDGEITLRLQVANFKSETEYRVDFKINEIPCEGGVLQNDDTRFTLAIPEELKAAEDLSVELVASELSETAPLTLKTVSLGSLEAYDLTTPQFMRNLTAGMSAQDLLAKTESSFAVLELTGPNGEAIESGLVITGATLKLKDQSGNILLDFGEVVVEGDCSGDGNITSVDLLVVRRYLAGKDALAGAYLLAADYHRNDTIDSRDLLAIRKYLVEKGKEQNA